LDGEEKGTKKKKKQNTRRYCHSLIAALTHTLSENNKIKGEIGALLVDTVAEFLSNGC
jgi:hypothetical protein